MRAKGGITGEFLAIIRTVISIILWSNEVDRPNFILMLNICRDRLKRVRAVVPQVPTLLTTSLD